MSAPRTHPSGFSGGRVRDEKPHSQFDTGMCKEDKVHTDFALRDDFFSALHFCLVCPIAVLVCG